MNIRNKYIVDEDYALYQLIQETEDSESLSLSDAKDYYKKLLAQDRN